MTLRTLGIDIGGTGLKASVVDSRGRLLTDKVRIDTPYPCPPEIMVNALVSLVAPLPEYDRISIGFPGVVRNGHVLTAPHFGTEQWAGFPLAQTLSKRLKAPAQLINDAEMQGLAVIGGHGLELVLTLGTGAGTGLYRDGELMPHLELAHHPVNKGKTYNDYIGNEALHKIGTKRWSKRVLKVIGILESLLHYDRLYIGGGNSGRLDEAELADNVVCVSNDAGIEGGAALWRTERKGAGKRTKKRS